MPGTTSTGGVSRLLSAHLIATATAATVVLALTLFAMLAVYQRHEAFNAAATTTRQEAAVLVEHAARIAEAGNLAMLQAVMLKDGRDWAAVAADRRAFELLVSMIAQVPFLQALWLVDGRGVPRLTNRGFPAPDYDVSERQHFLAQRERDQGTFFSRLLLSRVTGGTNIVATRRIDGPGGSFDGVAMAVFDPATFIDLYASLALPPGSEVTLFRQDLATLVRVPQLPAEVAVALEKWRQPAPALSDGVTQRTVSAADGIERIETVRSVPGLPLWVGVGVSVAGVEKAWRMRVLDQTFPAAAALVLVVAFGIAAWRAARREARAQLDLERRVQERTAALNATIEQRDLLMREVNHRVTNNLQIAASLLTMQAARADDPKIARYLEEARLRIGAIADLHGALYRVGDVTHMRLDLYIEQLCEGLRRTLIASEDTLTIETGLTPTVAPTDLAVPLGLILTELVTNAVKHGFPCSGPGRITIRLTRDGDECSLLVADNGAGADPSLAPGFGMRLVDALVAQLGGGLRRQADSDGTRSEVRFPLTERA